MGGSICLNKEKENELKSFFVRKVSRVSKGHHPAAVVFTATLAYERTHT